jgi:GPH family glycoside/pentoside/hexuronide:cation symporter
LTDVAGILPFIAGLINMIAICWNAVANPVVGYLTDTSRSKYGRRRPFMLIAIPLMALALILLFLPVGFENGFKNVYFILCSMLFWTAYVTYVIPYVALGAEITQDYNERNSLRGLNMVVGYTVLAICCSGPMAVQSVLVGKGYTVQQSWTATAVMLAALVVIFCLICWWKTRGMELPFAQEMTKKEDNNLIKIFRETAKIKPYRNIIIMVALFVIGFNVINSSLVYLLTYNAAFTYAQQSLFWLVYCGIIVCAQPFLIRLSARLGKKKMLLSATTLEIIVNLLFFFMIGISGVVTLYVYAAVLGVTSSCFWVLYISLVYDISEIDEFINGKRREGSLIAIVLFVQKFGAAFAMWLTGILLTTVGYVAGAEQSLGVLKGILMLCTLIPACFYIVSMLIFSRYPVTQERFNAIKEATARKRAGEEYSTEGFKELL